MHHKIKSFVAYAKGLVQTIIDHQLNLHLHSDDWQRTIYIDASAAKTTEFDLSDEKKAALVEAGRKGTREYFAWFDKGNSVNKVVAK